MMNSILKSKPIRSLQRWRRRLQRRGGFTFLEVLIATLLFSFFFSYFASFITSSMSNHQESKILSEAVNLAVLKMDQIKILRETKSEQGTFPSHPDFSFTYEISEIEKDLMEEAKSFGMDEVMPEEDRSNSQKQQDYLQSQNKTSTTETFAKIKLLFYKVNILYKGQFQYSLEYFKVPNL